jgi:uncharacterized protein
VANHGSLLYFLDTSAVAKLYHEEPGSAVMEALASSPTAELWITELTRAEFHSVCLRKVRKGELADEALQTVLACFNDDVRDRFEIVPWQEHMIETAIALLLQHGKARALRTLDALQLIAAQAVPRDNLTFVTADKKLTAVAKDIFGQAMNP